MRRLAGVLIVLCSRLVPRRTRDRWVEEWRAEIDHAAMELAACRFTWLRLLRMALGALPDVVAVRRAQRLTVATPRAGRLALVRGVVQDVRYACRSLGAARGFSFAVIASLSLGIAANVAAFALINALFFRALPGVERQDRVVSIELCRPGHSGCLRQASTLQEFAALRSSLPSAADVAARSQFFAAARVRGEAVTVRAAFVSRNYFDVLGTRLALGGGFAAHTADSAVAVISDEFWRRRFLRDRAVLGEFVDVGSRSVRVVGVAPPRFLASNTVGTFGGSEIWLPLDTAASAGSGAAAIMGTTTRSEDKGLFDLEYVARLAPWASRAQVRAEATVFAARSRPPHAGNGKLSWARVQRFGFKDADEALAAIAAIMPLPLLVLGIACLNATSLVLARSTYRLRDTVVRVALGASRWRIVRLLLMESLMLAAVAAALSVPFTYWSVALVQPHLPMIVSIDWHVLGFTAAVAAASAILFGLLPALRAASRHAPATLGSSRSGDAGVRAPRLRKVLVVVQVAASLALLATGGQSLSAVAAVISETGVDHPERVLIASFDLDKLKIAQSEGEAFYARVLHRVSLLPQVEAAGLARPRAMWTFGMGSGSSSVVVWRPEDRQEDGQWSYAGGYVKGDVFRAVGLAILQGRDFTPEDARASPQVAIVNRPMAERLFDTDAIGRTIRVAPRRQLNESLEVRIVGVVEPTIERHYSPKPVPAVYLPAPFTYEPTLALYIRSRTSMDALLPALQAAVRDVDPRVPFVDVGTVQARFEFHNKEEHILASGAAILGAVAMLLATAGLYGLFSFIVSLRQREIGVRMALGAEPSAVLRLVLNQALRLAMWGAGIGGAAALVAGAIVNANIYGTASIDPVMFLGSAAALSAAMLVAGLVPARRASRVDPIVVLRQD